MDSLIQIKQEGEKQLVSARELYNFLGYHTSQWKRWSKKNIIDDIYFTENKDYLVLDMMSISSNNKPFQDFSITLDMAKQLCMLARTQKGKEARDYFISVEKEYRNQIKPTSTLDLLELSIKSIRENKEELTELKGEVKQIKGQLNTRPNYFTVVGYGALNNIQVNLKLASSIGRKASQICKNRNLLMDEIPDARFGKVRMYPTEVLEEVFSQRLG